MGSLSSWPYIVLATVATFGKLAQGHEHGHSHIDEGEVISKDPLVCASEEAILQEHFP